jgi:hypothetical protein
MAGSNDIRAARAFLFKRGVKHLSPVKFAAAAKELGKDFTELLYLLGLMYDGPASSSKQIERFIDAEHLKLKETSQ